MSKGLKTILFLLFLICFLAGFSQIWAAGPGLGRRTLTFTQYLQYPRIWLSVIVGLAAGFLLIVLKIKIWQRALILAAVFVLFGVLPAVFSENAFFAKLSAHPSPLCAVTKPVLFSLRMNQFIFPAVFAGVLTLITFLSIVGNKLFCGWVCPIGALQELAHMVPMKLKRIKLVFYIINTLRAVLLIGFIPVLVMFGIVLYDYFNPFQMLHWTLGTDFWTLYIWAVVAVTIICSFFVFRPFCHAVCPIGILTWLMEQFSLFRIRFHKDRCNQCFACIKEVPCLAMPSILGQKRIRPDCYACGKCIAVCPTKALEFNIRNGKK
jgi:polyferredoxin